MNLLAHYTDSSGLLGIVEKASMWFSDARYLNDSAEISQGEQQLRKVLDERIAQTQAGAERNQLTAMRREIEAAFNESLPLVACFSTAIDSLAQWRGYGRSRVGACLCFDRDLLQAYLQRQHAHAAPKLANCVYDEKEQVALLELAIEEALVDRRHRPDPPTLSEVIRLVPMGFIHARFPFFENALDESTKDPKDRSALSQRTLKELWDYSVDRVPFTRFAYRLQTVLPLIKHHSFEAEKEVRALRVEHWTEPLNFRSNERLLVPYRPIQVMPNVEKVNEGPNIEYPLKTIIVGPGPDQARICDAVQLLLHSREMWDVEVAKSSCTYVP